MNGMRLAGGAGMDGTHGIHLGTGAAGPVPAPQGVALALQGGGSHGAFTWGVLDRLLEEPGFTVAGLSGASAGAVNAVMLAHGYVRGGAEGAREALAAFWEAVGRSAPWNALGLGMGSDVLGALGANDAARARAPLNPFEPSPLRDILRQQVDFEQLRAHAPMRLFVAATEVLSGRLRLFRNAELTLEAVLASACVPTLHEPIEIDGQAYWDGGLAANPPLFPLVHQCRARDVVAVLLHPRGAAASQPAADIAKRMMEIRFASSWLGQLHGAAAAGRAERPPSAPRLHVIEDGALMRSLQPPSRLDTRPAFLHALRDAGREQAEQWLQRRDGDLAQGSSAIGPHRSEAAVLHA
jgi:NTE family protein